MTSTDMTSSDTTATVAATARFRDRGLRPYIFAALLLLLLQYALGMWVNLFATIPAPDHGNGLFTAFGSAVTRGPVGLTLHALLGTFLVASAIALVIRAARTRKATPTVLSSVGLLAIIAAWVNGALFVGNGANGSSFGMAMGAGLALLCYVTMLFHSGRAATRAT
jgi:heme A synthase